MCVMSGVIEGEQVPMPFNKTNHINEEKNYEKI